MIAKDSRCSASLCQDDTTDPALTAAHFTREPTAGLPALLLAHSRVIGMGRISSRSRCEGPQRLPTLRRHVIMRVRHQFPTT